MHSATSSIWSREMKLKVSGETGAIHIMARDPDRQTAEIHIRIALMNCFNVLGTTKIVRVA